MKRILFTAATLIGAAGASLALALPASAATSLHGPAVPNATVACSGLCTNLFDQQEGNQYILATNGKYNSPVVVRHASNSAKSEDFQVTQVGILGDFCKLDGGTGLIPNNSYACVNYSASFPVYEAEYAPGSFTSGLCIAVKGKAVNGSKVILRDCGAAAHSLFVADVNNDVTDSNSLIGVDFPLLNASDSSLSHQLVLNYNGVGKQVTTREIAGNGGAINDSQEWGITLVA